MKTLADTRHTEDGPVLSGLVSHTSYDEESLILQDGGSAYFFSTRLESR